MHNTYTYIIFAVLSLVLIVGIYFYLKPTQGQTGSSGQGQTGSSGQGQTGSSGQGQTGQISLDQIKVKTIVELNKFIQYMFQSIIKSLNDRGDFSFALKKRLIDEVVVAQVPVDSYKIQMAENINKSTNKKDIYDNYVVDIYENLWKNYIKTSYTSDIPQETVQDIEQKANDLLKKLNF